MGKRVDDALEAFRKIYKDFGVFCRKRGEVSEEDTRANILDRVLHEVLGWPRDCVYREVYVNPGFLDYELSIGKPTVVIEAKKSGVSFVFPFRKKYPKSLKVGGVLSTDKEIRKAVEQTQRYCSDKGIGFGVATNGYAFVIFRALVEGMPWRERNAYVFASIKEVEERFTEFWNLLSYPAVSAGKLREAFLPVGGEGRGFSRPVEMILDADANYNRNPINVALRPYVSKFFGDIAAQDDIEILERCYVRTVPLQIIDESLKLMIKDTIPEFASSAVQIRMSREERGGQVEREVRRVVEGKRATGTVILIMGGIGSGKSTFLKRFFKVVIDDLVGADGPALEIYLDFSGAPELLDELRGFFWSKLCDVLKSRLPNITQKETLERLFRTEMEVIGNIYADDEDGCRKKMAERLEELFSNRERLSVAALRHAVSEGRMPIMVFDNVDQLRLKAQVEIFSYAQRLAKSNLCMSIIVLREESYYAAQMQKHLTAYSIRSYHLSSPRFVELFRARLDFATAAAAEKQRRNVLTEEGHNVQQVLDFFRLLRGSILDVRKKYLARLIESISFGNARLALKLLEEFMTSGTTNIVKILDRFYSEGGYTVPFHEFAKSIILGERRFYKEPRSFVLNVFNVSDKRNASHFTALRILRYLTKVGATVREREGFVNIQQLLTDVVDIFDNEQDCLWNIMRLIDRRRQLIELNTRRTETLAGASSARITASGTYYLGLFVRAFAYLDLMWHDTPFDDEGIATALSRLMHTTDMYKRFKRVEIFLDYLDTEEMTELGEHGLLHPRKKGFYGPFVPDIRHRYEGEKREICKKLGLEDGAGESDRHD
jgi:hypothetical protein